MNNEINRAIAALFPEGGDHVADIKFFPGSKANATAEQFAEEVTKANAQIRNGIAVRSATLDSELTA